jgi:dihydroxyacetone kinase
LNFGVALEKAKQEGYLVKMIIVDDDSALPTGKGITGGRGLAGTIFVHKIAGSLAANKKDLDYIHQYLTSSVIPFIRTLGIALSTCTVPGTPVSDRLSSSSIYEVGLGIHGEPGKERCKIPETNFAQMIATTLIHGLIEIQHSTNSNSSLENQVLKKSKTESIENHTINHRPQLLNIEKSDKLVLMINNLGSLPIIELQIVVREVLFHMKHLNLNPVRIYIGHFMTSLEMTGLSLSVMKISEPEALDHLDSACSTPAWHYAQPMDLHTSNTLENQTIGYDEKEYGTRNARVRESGARVRVSLVHGVCETIQALEATLTAYDKVCGDGDCGVVMHAGAVRVLSDLATRPVQADEYTEDAIVILDCIADAVSASMGGTSGGLLEVCLRAMSGRLSVLSTSALNPSDRWTDALCDGVTAIQTYGGMSVARPIHRL